MSKFKVGDRVVCEIDSWGKGIKGLLGTVIHNKGGVVGIEFDRHIKGHECGGHGCHGKEGHCWNVKEHECKLAFDVAPLCISRKTLPLSSIHITSAFSDHLPDPKKITKCYEFFKANGEFNKDIVINMRNVLVDGYVSYLVAKMVGMESVPVLQTNSDTLDKPKKAKEASPEKPAKAAPKFKVGDKVKVVKNVTSVSGKDRYIGKVYEISSIQDTNQYGQKYGVGEVYVVYENELEPYSEPAPTSTEPTFKPGGKAKCVGAGSEGKLFLIGKTYDIDSDGHVKDESGFTFNRCGYSTAIGWLHNRSRYRFEPVNETENPDKQEVVKLYCVKEYKPGHWLTKGKVYNVVNGRITFDDGYVDDYDDIPIFEKGTEIDSLCVPLVKRPAKVGEWVYILDNAEGTVECYIGKIVKIEELGHCLGFCRARGDRGYMFPINYSEYLTLDGYQPESEKPKYYSGKVVCVSTSGVEPNFTVGKVYEYRDGLVNCDKPKPYNEGNPAKTKEEALNRLFVTFIELKQ